MEYYTNDNDWIYAIDDKGNGLRYNWNEKKFVPRVIL